jgi:CBS domain-containing protein
MEVGQLMTRNPRVCSIDGTLEQAAAIMWESDCGCVPLVDSEGKVTGMITDRDVCMAAYTQGRTLASRACPISVLQGRRVGFGNLPS